ncbi:hypothetical protein WH47_10447 [Habropoda laboriosa]|uniref:Odorant receptor 13a n=1 Tax=Habropoda laboriosa TaxID=597456 RepID=A0A0L7QME8_9HYME|nr:hypothetical protein WH47_10447 [Habropoda laboriosa]
MRNTETSLIDVSLLPFTVECQLCVHFRLASIIPQMALVTSSTDSTWNTDWMYSVQMNRWFLKPIGVWPLSLCVTTLEKISSVVLALISCFLIGFLLVPCALCTVLDKTGDLDTKIKMIGPLSFCTMATIKYYILMSRGGKIGKCVNDIRTDWSLTLSYRQEEEREIMRDSARIGRSLAIFSAGFMYSGGVFYTAVMPLFAVRTEIIDNETVRSQAFPIYRGLLDPRTSPSFEIVQFMQCLAAFVLYSVTVGACSLIAVFVMHVCGQFRILVTKLDKLIDGVKGRKSLSTHEQRLGDIIEHHLKILGCFLIGFLLVPCALCTVLDKTGDLDTKIKMIGPLSFCMMAAIKYYILISRGGKIGQCVKDIRADWSLTLSHSQEEEREIMRDSARIGRSLAIFCAGFMYSGGFFYTTVMPLCTVRTEIIDNETVRSQAFPIYRGLLDPRTSPSFEIVQFMQCLAAFVIYSVTVGACSLAAVFVMHVCGQFRILVTKLDKLVDGVKGRKGLSTHEQRLGDIIEHHLKILG